MSLRENQLKLNLSVGGMSRNRWERNIGCLIQKVTDRDEKTRGLKGAGVDSALPQRKLLVHILHVITCPEHSD